jgi:hypothetical protein
MLLGFGPGLVLDLGRNHGPPRLCVCVCVCVCVSVCLGFLLVPYPPQPDALKSNPMVCLYPGSPLGHGARLAMEPRFDKSQLLKTNHPMKEPTHSQMTSPTGAFQILFTKPEPSNVNDRHSFKRVWG